MLTAKRPALRRLWIIDRELRAQTYPTAQCLAALTEVDPKTVRRDLSLMRDVYQAPVAYNCACGGWEYTEPTFRFPAVVITGGELVALFLAGQALRQVQGTPYAGDLQRAIQKLAQFLPDEVSFHWQTLDQVHSFRHSVTLQLTLRSLIEIRRWILSWGSECEGLAPLQLRDDIQREAAAVVRQSTRASPAPLSSTDKSLLESVQRRQGQRQRTGKKTGRPILNPGSDPCRTRRYRRHAHAR